MDDRSSRSEGSKEREIEESDRRERLQKVLANAGVESRRAAEALILSGRVAVNGAPVTTLGTKVDPERDVVAVDGRPIPRRVRRAYLLLNKPAGYITTLRDPFGRPTVMEFVPDSPRVYPVGRLDADSEGLILLTNDGDFANTVAHPRHLLEKEYHVAVPGRVTESGLRALRSGVEIDGRMTAPAQVSMLRFDGRTTWLSIAIHEGRNRQIRKMLQSLGYRVERLVRVRIGPIRLGSIPQGSYRHLTTSEIRQLKGANA
jgi:23S rRNA pseudouridine2605 synthase